MLADALIAKDCVKNAVVSGVKVGSICVKKTKANLNYVVLGDVLRNLIDTNATIGVKALFLHFNRKNKKLRYERKRRYSSAQCSDRG